MLGGGWSAIYTSAGSASCYYHNDVSGITQWELPAGCEHNDNNDDDDDVLALLDSDMSAIHMGHALGATCTVRVISYR